MPWGLKRFHQSRDLHFITFSCYRRKRKLNSPESRRIFEQALERTRRQYVFYKQGVSRRLALRASEPFWQPRYYDFNVWSAKKRVGKLRYIHRNPVKRGLVEKPEDWEWSSFRHYFTGKPGIVEIESEWTARRRERMGIRAQLKVRELPHPSKSS